MTTRSNHVALAAIAVMIAGLAGYSQPVSAQLQNMDQYTKRLREKEAKTSQAREAAFNAELKKQEQAVRDALARRNTAEARGNALNKAFDDNAARLEEMTVLLRQHEGNLGELFGVTRQIAGDAANVLQQSMLTVQFPPAEGEEDRFDFLVRMAGAKALPSIFELERMWFELQREMIETGKVVRFETPVLVPGQEEPQNMEVVRVGPFIASSNGSFLGYLPSAKSLSVLERQVGSELRNVGRELQAPSDGSSAYRRAVVDPARGVLLTRYVERPNIIERIKNGEAVNFVIIFVGILGVVVAAIQYVYLFVTKSAVRSQVNNLATPRAGNPLGRVILAFRGDGKPIENTELAELRVSEAVLREIPKLERFQSFLRLAVAAGPLLGLIGTVVGMIITFHAITASGSSDPRLMAHGIGTAMMATVLGLGIAIPLLFINAGLAALSNSVTQMLDEQSQSLLARDMAARKQQFA